VLFIVYVPMLINRSRLRVEDSASKSQNLRIHGQGLLSTPCSPFAWCHCDQHAPCADIVATLTVLFTACSALPSFSSSAASATASAIVGLLREHVLFRLRFPYIMFVPSLSW
jgi:hypothetical protein